MISHLFVGVRDFRRCKEFYDDVLGILGWEARFVDLSRPWGGWQVRGADRPLFLVGAPHDGREARPGNGNMIALDAKNRATVDAFHRIALNQGGSCDGAPGLRPHYHDHYYGAYVRDPEGNKLAACCHRPE